MGREYERSGSDGIFLPERREADPKDKVVWSVRKKTG